MSGRLVWRLFSFHFPVTGWLREFNKNPKRSHIWPTEIRILASAKVSIREFVDILCFTFCKWRAGLVSVLLKMEKLKDEKTSIEKTLAPDFEVNEAVCCNGIATENGILIARRTGNAPPSRLLKRREFKTTEYTKRGEAEVAKADRLQPRRGVSAAANTRKSFSRVGGEM